MSKTDVLLCSLYFNKGLNKIAQKMFLILFDCAHSDTHLVIFSYRKQNTVEENVSLLQGCKNLLQI